MFGKKHKIQKKDREEIRSVRTKRSRLTAFVSAAAMSLSLLATGGLSGAATGTVYAQSTNGSRITFSGDRQIKNYNYSDISYNYAKLLQYSL